MYSAQRFHSEECFEVYPRVRRDWLLQQDEHQVVACTEMYRVHHAVFESSLMDTDFDHHVYMVHGHRLTQQLGRMEPLHE